MITNLKMNFKMYGEKKLVVLTVMNTNIFAYRDFNEFYTNSFAQDCSRLATCN